MLPSRSMVHILPVPSGTSCSKEAKMKIGLRSPHSPRAFQTTSTPCLVNVPFWTPRTTGELKCSWRSR